MIFIDRVSTSAEAKELQDIGVKIIGISLKHSTAFDDNRVLDISTACEIREVLSRSKLVIEIPRNDSDLLTYIDKLNPDYIKVSDGDVLSIDTINTLKLKKNAIFFSGVIVSPDDDPSWITNRFEDANTLSVFFYHIDIFGDYQNSWNFLKNESPKYPDEIQVKDIIDISEQFPLIISLDINEYNVLEIINTFKSAQGFCFTLSEKVNRNDIHCFDYQSVLKVLNVIKHKG